MTLDIELAEPYAAMLEELEAHGESDPHADIKRLVEGAIHDGYQQLQSNGY